MKLSFLALLLSSPAFAASSCELPGGSFVVTVDHGVVSSTLTINNEEIPVLRDCETQGRVPKGDTIYRCTHQADGVRYEAYPQFSKEQEGVLSALRVLVWSGNSSDVLLGTNCQ